MAEKHVHKVYGSFPPWGKSVEFPSGGGGNYVYFDISGLSDGDKEAFLGLASLAKLSQDGGLAVIPMSLSILVDSPTTSYLALAVDESAKILMNGEYATIGEMLNAGSGPALPPRITEEEFYALPAQFTLMYGDEPKTYFYNDGMTWEEWIDSSYNDGNFRISELNLGEGKTFYVKYKGDVVRAEVDYDYGYVKPHRQIQSDIRYWRPVGAPI